MFDQQLLGAFRALGLDAAPARDGQSITFCCPACELGKLEVADGLVSCGECSWGAEGEPWAIAESARKRAPKGDGSDFSELDARLIRLDQKPEKPVPLVTINGQQISTAGNITAISAQAKAGKSAFIGAVLAAMYGRTDPGDPFDADRFLGVECAPADGAVILWDTEQSPYDSWRNLDRAARRAKASFPESFRPYRLLDVSVEQRRAWLSQDIERQAQRWGSVHAIIVDGVADLCRSPNDEEEAFALVDELFQLAVGFACPVIGIIHENPGSRDSGKTRGHLGSQLERKAESNLRLVKGADEVTEVYSVLCRSASLPRGKGVFFEWSEDAGMHVLTQREAPKSKSEQKRDSEAEAVAAVFAGVTGQIAYADLGKKISEVTNVSIGTANRRITAWAMNGLIRRVSQGLYIKC